MTAAVVRMRKRESLGMWLGSILNDPDITDGGKTPVTAIALVHMVGPMAKEIHTCRFGGRQWTPGELEELFMLKAQGHAQDLPGTQMFQLWVYIEGSKEYAVFRPFSINGEGEFGNSLNTESPTKDGIVQQLMRHVDNTLDSCNRRQAQLDQVSLGLVAQVYQLNTQLMSVVTTQAAELNAAAELHRSLILGRAADDHAQRMRELEFARQTEERRKWMTFGPALINTVLGREIFPQSTEDTSLIESVAENLTDEHVEKLLSLNLPGHVIGPLAGRIQKAIEAKKVREERTVALARASANTNPEEDAAGN